MKTISQSRSFNASPEEVFDCLDDLGVTGIHMTESSMPMMGGKMALEFLTPHKKGPDSKLIIYSWFRMNLNIRSVPGGAEAQLSISYTRPKGLFNRIICSMLGNWYCNWCIRNMLNDTAAKINKAHPEALTSL